MSVDIAIIISFTLIIYLSVFSLYLIVYICYHFMANKDFYSIMPWLFSLYNTQWRVMLGHFTQNTMQSAETEPSCSSINTHSPTVSV